MTKIRERLITSAKLGDFLATIFELYLQETDKREELSQHLVNLHNAREIDTIAEFCKLENANKSHEFFMILSILKPVIPKIAAPVTQVMKCVKHLTLEAGDDMAADILITPFIEFLAAEPYRPEEVLRIALADIDGEFHFITPAILAGAKFGLKKYVLKAIDLSQHTNTQVQTSAVYALGEINYNHDEDLITKALAAIESVIVRNFNEHLFESALRTSYSLYKYNNDLEKRVAEIFKIILKNKNDSILHVASKVLWLQDGIPKPIVKLLLDALIYTKPKNTATLSNIDYGLVKLLKKNQSKETEAVVIFLEKILLKERDIFITQFNNVNLEIIGNIEMFPQVVTRWLLSKRLKLGKSVSDLLSSSNQKHYRLSVDEEQLQKLDNGTCLFLAKKASGWFFMQPVSAASFIVSLINKASEDERQKIAEILFNPLLISYSGSAKEYLESVLQNASEIQASIINDVLAKLENYHKGLKAAWDTKELMPLVAHREAYHRHHARLMEQSMLEAEKDSFFLNLVTQEVILYGNKTINYFKPSLEGLATRQEMKLQPYSVSIELPSIEHLDHNGLEYRLRSFKFEGYTS